MCKYDKESRIKNESNAIRIVQNQSIPMSIAKISKNCNKCCKI